MTTRLRYRSLPILWQLLSPFVVLMVAVGALGTFLIVRELSTRADSDLSRDLARRSVDAQALLRERELYLLESATIAANLEGVASAIERGDSGRLSELLQSVMALKSELASVAITDTGGRGMVEVARAASGVDVRTGVDLSAWHPVGRALVGPDARKHAGLVDGSRFVIAAPVCGASSPCVPVGTAVVAVEAASLMAAASGDAIAADEDATPTAVALYDVDGQVVASQGRSFTAKPAEELAEPRRTEDVDTDEWTTAHVRYESQGDVIGTLAVSIPTASARSGVRDAAIGLGLLVLASTAVAIVVGVMLSRRIVRSIRAVLTTHAAIGRGDLLARAPVDGDDELSALARGVNEMADQLQASYETLELRVAQRTEEVERLLRERTEFFTSLSHELRTPLAVIIGEARMIEDAEGRRTAAWARETAAKLNLSAQQLLAVVNEILDLARAESGRVDVELGDVAVTAVLDELRPTIEGLAQGAELDVTFDIADDVAPVRADPGRVRDILANLVDNAVKYTPAGGRVTVSASSANGSVKVSVADTGVGVPAGVGDRLFEPFYRVPGVRPHGGRPSSGLGLAIAKRLVEAQGGELHYSSDEGRGSVFTVVLPRSDHG